MPVAPTYPGVYIEEIPSGVRTLTGVATSITAFIGYTARGPVNSPVHIFSFADFERAFDGLAVDSPVSYGVKQFFQNGGGEAYVVRVAQGAAPARVSLLNNVTGGVAVLVVTAASEGTWGNNVQLDVDYDTVNPASLFNVTVTELVDQGGRRVPGRTERFRNLSMNSFDASYAVDTINAGSELVRTARDAGALGALGAATSTSGTLTDADLNAVDATHKTVACNINGQGTFEFDLAPIAAGTLGNRLAALASAIAGAINAVRGAGSVTGSSDAGAGTVTITSTFSTPAERASVRFMAASQNSATAVLRLGTANGGTETDAVAPIRPVQTGTVGGALGLPGATFTPTGTASGAIDVQVIRGSATVATVTLHLWGTGSGTPPLTAPTTVGGVLAALQTAVQSSTHAALAGAVAALIGRRLRVAPGPADPNVVFQFAAAGADTTADEINLIAADAAENMARYALGVGAATLAQAAPLLGSDGTPPGVTEFQGNEANKTGFFALEDVDLFNILSLPEVAGFRDSEYRSVYMDAVAYCERRRAFLIIDLPATVDTLPEAQAWLSGSGASLRTRNAAAYFPRLRAPDPLMNSMVHDFAPSGALAGLYARTDAERGVWKAPAGTDALLSGAVGLTVALTDKENGVLNPLGLNSLRTFPVFGTVAWGARTMRGADQMADEYKYVPIRRLALFLEESLYRGTKWVVFEPNDEPLWAQIRLNLGAFMHTLFSQGAFQGKSPREAYFVKCDKETTTQNDIDLGRVNIIVGFAPLKPAEFVIIKIQQIAGQIQT